MATYHSAPDLHFPDSSPTLAGTTATSANRRRLRVFLLVFVVAVIAGLTWDFSREAQYRSQARIQLDFPGDGGEERAKEPEARKSSLSAEISVMTSRPVVEAALTRMRAAGKELPVAGDAEEIAHRLIEANLSGATVTLTASGRPPAALAALLDAMVEVYREQLAQRSQAGSSNAARQAQDEERSLRTRVETARAAIDAFRSRHNIVSLERDENQVLAQVKGLGVSLNAAREKAVAAEARLRSVMQSIESGKSVVRAKDNPTLSNLEQRLSQLREELRDMERNFTPDLMAFDPRAKALRARIADLEGQIRQTRESAQQAALAEAQEEAAATRATVDQLTRQIGNDRQTVQQFTARHEQYRTMQEELGQLEQLHRAALARLAGQEASGLSRLPVATIVEAANMPSVPSSPAYLRDAAICVAAALLLALLCAWVVEFFNQTESGPSLVVAPAWMPTLPAGHPAPPPALAEAQPLRLANVATLPRALDSAEVEALVAAAEGSAKIIVVALLSGLSRDDLAALRRADVDLDAGTIQVRGRIIAGQQPLLALLAGYSGAPETLVVEDGRGGPCSEDEIASAVLVSAHDAGIEAANEVTPAVLEHTYLLFLVAQGARFSDLARLVGRLSAERLSAYSALAPAGSKKPIEALELVLPGLASATRAGA